MTSDFGSEEEAAWSDQAVPRRNCAAGRRGEGEINGIKLWSRGQAIGRRSKGGALPISSCRSLLSFSLLSPSLVLSSLSVPRSLFSLRPFGAARPFSRRQEERGCKVQGSAGLPEVRRPSSSPCGCTHSLGGEQACGSMGVGPPVGARGCGSAGRTLRGRTTVGVALTVFLMVETKQVNGMPF
jgi:hypothetical protein